MTATLSLVCLSILMFRFDSAALISNILPSHFLATTQVSAKSKPRDEGKTIDTPKTISNGTPEKLTDAEKFARLQRAIESDEKTLKSMEQQLASPVSEFQKAEAEYKQLDKKLSEKEQELTKFKEAGNEVQVQKQQLACDALRKEWQLSKERFNLAIQERKTMQEKILLLKEKIQKDRLTIEKLTNTTATPKEASTPDEKASGKPVPTSESKPKVQSSEAPTASPLKTALSAVPNSTRESVPVEKPEAKDAPPAEKPSTKPVPKELIETRKELKASEDDALLAQEQAKSISERIEVVRRNILSEKSLLQAARKKVDIAVEAQSTYQGELQRLLSTQHKDSEVRAIRTKMEEAATRIKEAEKLQRQSSSRIQELLSDLTALQHEQVIALQESKHKKEATESVQKKLNWLEHPLHPRNIGIWLVENGPKVVTILLCMVGLHLVVRSTSWRLVNTMARTNQRGTEADRRNRAESLIGVFRHVAAFLIFGGGTLMLLESVGIPIVPLLGGAAVIGLAVAFGSQNLIRDYFAGFMVLLEDQYSINDVVKINNISGQVEKISLRVTVLRDISGVVHFVPHGTIVNVSNLTHGWSRAFFEIGVAYKEDVELVMKILLEQASELRKDPDFEQLILEDAEMLGVDSFGTSSVNIQFYIKTMPLKQWTVKRELLRRIKHRFDELGIEIPFPHSKVILQPGKEDAMNMLDLEQLKKAA